MKVCVLSANLGAYDQPSAWPELIAPPGVEVSVLRLTDETCPPRPLAMTSRLQCGIPKWFGSEFAPDADVIIWIDASCAPTEHAVSWFLAHLGDSHDLAVFRHPDRRTVREEYEFIKARMARPGETYLTSRYLGEWLDEEFARIERMGQSEALLFASTAFAYWAHYDMNEMLREVFAWKARYHLHDQLAFAAIVANWLEDDDFDSRSVAVIPDNYLKCPALTFVRKGVRRTA